MQPLFIFIQYYIKLHIMPYVSVYIHFVWSTKNGYPCLDTPELRQKVWHHISENAEEKGIFVDFINGYSNHCHCLVSLSADMTISKTMQLIKGESSFWINKNKLCKRKFGWQEEYYAVSVSESSVNRVRNYIRNQEEHHKKKTFKEEEDEFVARFGFTKLSDSEVDDPSVKVDDPSIKVDDLSIKVDDPSIKVDDPPTKVGGNSISSD
jgi:putative transposase